jgi:hypothetical protein
MQKHQSQSRFTCTADRYYAAPHSEKLRYGSESDPDDWASWEHPDREKLFEFIALDGHQYTKWGCPHCGWRWDERHGT